MPFADSHSSTTFFATEPFWCGDANWPKLMESQTPRRASTPQVPLQALTGRELHQRRAWALGVQSH